MEMVTDSLKSSIIQKKTNKRKEQGLKLIGFIYLSNLYDTFPSDSPQDVKQ